MGIAPAELGRWQRQIEAQQRRLEEQQRELEQQRAALAHLQRRLLAELPERGDSGSAQRQLQESAQRSPRRRLLKGAGAGAAALLGAGMLAAGEGAAGATARAEADNGAPLVIGQANTGSSPTILNPAANTAPEVLLGVDNSASTSRTDATAGVQAVGPAGTTGLIGISNSSTGFGVLGQSDQGYGVVGESSSGIDLAAYGSGRLYQIPLAAPGAPAAGGYLAGEQVRDADGDLYLCVAAGTPGVWRKALGVVSGYRAGALYFLAAPIRILDTRPGSGAPISRSTPLASNETFTFQVTTTAVGGVSVPLGAVALLGNLTVVNTQGLGDLRVFAAGLALPLVSSINYTTANQIIANAVIAALSADGKLSIHVDGAGTDAILDLAGFVQ